MTATLERALHSLSAGRPVVVLAGQDGQGEGHLVLAAESATTSRVAFFVRHTSGFLCVALPGADCDRLRLPPIPGPGTAATAADQRVSVDAARGVRTGISARDRARTIAELADPASTPNDFTRPGHVVPLRARDGACFPGRGAPRPPLTSPDSPGCGLLRCSPGSSAPRTAASPWPDLPN